jgi:RNA polymerase sigma factor (sigma-70 family)
MGSMLLHRFRAERLLRDEFESLRADVTGNVAARLRAAGVHLDPCDLDACYAAAWQGLYAAMLDGQTVDRPAGWLALVTYRRALDEHRARRRIAYTPLEDHGEGGSSEAGSSLRTPIAAAFAGARQRDLAAELDDRTRLRQLLEALCARLSAREREAAALCYLQGLSRAEAAAQMGISESRMRKLMEGRGSARPGVCAKLGALVETIDAGRWCEEQGSLMRGFAYGILDPQGERYRLARAHHTGCPSCRAYVLSLRGLAAVLPPVPAMLHLALGAAAGAGSATGAGAGVAGGVGSGASGSALSASGAAGAGAAGGGWWLAGAPVGAKLAVGCMLALGVGAGCVALEGHSHGGRIAPHRHITRASAERRGAPIGAAPAEGHAATSALAPVAAGAATAPTEDVRHSSVVTTSARAAREFGLEQAARAEASAQAAPRRPTALARTASAGGSSGSSAAGAPASASRASSDAGAPARTSVPAAAREFAPG